jgi:glucose repression regulatory protein TUP1
LDKLVRVWNVESGLVENVFEGHTDAAYCTEFSNLSDSLLVSGALDKTLRIWDLNAKKGQSSNVKIVNGHTDFVLSVAISPNDKWIVSSSKDKAIHLLNQATLEHKATIVGHSNSGNNIFFL